MDRPDPFENDPFFKWGGDNNWNACIGSQGTELNYLDGYIEAAIELADAVVGRKLIRQRDTLVLPILYNARHALELVLKFSTEELIKAGAIKGERYSRDHDIRALYDRLIGSNIPDETLVRTLAALRPFIDSLAGVDDDGQELRYHRNRAEEKSLKAYSIANLGTIGESLRELKALIDALKNRTMDFFAERAAATNKKGRSRTDLLAIARSLPPRAEWITAAFDEAKAAIRERYQMSGKQFEMALNDIQANREMAAILGVETPLRHLTDDQVVATAERWRGLHPRRDPKDDTGIGVYSASRFRDEAVDAGGERRAAKAGVIAEIDHDLSAEALAELEAIYYNGLKGEYVEYHDQDLDRIKREHAANKDRRQEIQHLISKTNFLSCLRSAAPKLGRLDLACRLEDI